MSEYDTDWSRVPPSPRLTGLAHFFNDSKRSPSLPFSLSNKTFLRVPPLATSSSHRYLRWARLLGPNSHLDISTRLGLDYLYPYSLYRPDCSPVVPPFAQLGFEISRFSSHCQAQTQLSGLDFSLFLLQILFF